MKHALERRREGLSERRPERGRNDWRKEGRVEADIQMDGQNEKSKEGRDGERGK